MPSAKKNILSASTVAVIAAVLVFNTVFDTQRYKEPERVIEWDVINFYSYLPAAFIEHDLTLQFVRNDMERYYCSDHYWPEILPDSTMVIKTTMGLSLLYCPFFLVADSLAEPLGFTPDGFSPPYALALILACVFWVIVGCIYLRKALLQHFSDLTTSIVIGITVLATNLLWYSTQEAPYAHGFLFALISIFLYQTQRWHRGPSWRCTVAIGLNIGLISLIRPTDALVLLCFLLYDVASWKELKEKASLFLRRWPEVLVMAAAALAVWIPQMVYWHAVTGHLFFYSYTGNERFFWLQPKLVDFLVGFRKGWLLYTPVMAFALLGLIPLYRHHRRWFYATLVFLLLDVYVLSCWWCWWFGGCFGQRSMVDCYGLMAFPLAAFVEWMMRRRGVRRVALIVFFAAVTGLSFFHYKQYKHEAIHYDSMTREAYLANFGHKRPTAQYWELLERPDYEAAQRGER